ncbi:unnamed protein product [Rhizophagus irregularis]|nr:unnamed protein product [Rhizophagus irregularis]CAB5383786.1 unnamed protein product [Rhizophagus irregularis]
MPINIKIKLASWSEDCIYFQISEPNLDSSDVISDDYDQLTDIEITICVLYPNYENLKIDNRNIENSHDLIGCILTESTKVIPFPKFFPLISEITDQEDLTQYLRNMDIDTKKSNDDVTEVETIMKLNFVNYEKTFEKPHCAP